MRRPDLASSHAIREAAHEVQRPVFYSIGIIITAYMPIFTLQRVEGRLFKPMAWTVSFALLGALIFAMLIAPVLCSFVFREEHEGVAQPVMTGMTDGLYGIAAMGIQYRWVTVGHAARHLGAICMAHDQRNHRIRISAASRRRRHLGARHAGAQHGTD